MACQEVLQVGKEEKGPFWQGMVLLAKTVGCDGC